MKIEVVTVSINYSDYLERCIDQNCSLLDRWIIVTSKTDIKTRDLCSQFDKIDIVLTKVPFVPGQTFPKGRMINEGFDEFYGWEWLAHMDSDICLPSNMRSVMDHMELEEDCLYGFDYRWMIGPNGERIRYMAPTERILGYWQMFHVDYIQPYPENSMDAGVDDMDFNDLWHPTKRKKIIGIVPEHYGVDNLNWKGRIPNV
jgi:hypothetical protein